MKRSLITTLILWVGKENEGGLRLRCKATLTFLNSFWLTPVVLSVGVDCMDILDEEKGSCKLLYKQTSGEDMGE